MPALIYFPKSPAAFTMSALMRGWQLLKAGGGQKLKNPMFNPKQMSHRPKQDRRPPEIIASLDIPQRPRLIPSCPGKPASQYE